jgi:starch synthase (maltosyl-transferring)
MDIDISSSPARDGRVRVVIETVRPEIDGGRFAVKRVRGETVTVEADIFADGHDAVTAVLLFRGPGESQWKSIRMEPLVNDRWRAVFHVTELGDYCYTIEAWVDRFETWRRGLVKKIAAGQDVALELRGGAELLASAGRGAAAEDRHAFETLAAALRASEGHSGATALATQAAGLMEKYSERLWPARYRDLRVRVEREKARFSAWYEMFPRSCSDRPGAHGTFRDCERRLPYIAAMGFDVLYLPPIHPIGSSYRKGKNNTLTAAPEDVGSPWAIGSREGGHKAIHSQLGTLKDLRRLIERAKDSGIEIALDIAFQCTPDHPYVSEHPEWFRKRPDGSIQYAENPPKKYQDIYPVDFETEAWQELWLELKSVFIFWCEQGIRIFRVDNPHTKPFPFWQWVIAEVQQQFPDTLFLAEAFTRPKVMYRLGKLGFSQSYSYFAWRNTKWELTQYFTELTQTDVREFFRPNLWPNTPDILTEHLQFGGRPAFVGRFILAATLGANYGIYGPAFELCENVAREPGSEEYLNSEKYEVRRWDLDRPDTLKDLIGRVNRVRKENSALHGDHSLRFHPVDNPEIICFSKQNDDGSNTVIVVVNLDPHHVQSGWVELPLAELGLPVQQPYQMHELLTEARYLWHGSRNFVRLDPQSVPAQIFRVRRHLRREQDFDYFM